MRLARVLETGTIRSRLLGALVLLAVMPILVLVVSLVLLRSAFGDARRVELAASLRMGGFLVAAEVGAYTVVPDPNCLMLVQSEFARMEDVLAGLEEGSDSLRVRQVGDPASRGHIAATRVALSQHRTVAERAIGEARSELSAARRAALAHEVLGSAHALLATTQDLVGALEARSAASLRRLWIFQAVAVALAAAVLGLTVWAVNRYILQPIPQLLRALGEVGSGRYGQQVEVRGENEFSAVASGFNRMSSDLERIHHQILVQQAEILEKNAELERGSTLKSQFVANMSHELRTPLNAIIGYTKLLRGGVFGPLPAPMQEPLQGIDETSAALLRLINDILDVAKIEAGKVDLHLEPLLVTDIAREVGEMLQPLALAKGLRLEVAADGDVPLLTSDRDKLRRILLNLAGNAVKFTRHGRVRVRVMAAPPGGPAAPAGVLVVVEDTGIGIAPEHLETIFEDFHQIDGTAAREHGGTGLGLAISRRLARHLGGQIRVESQLGRGSTFTLVLPPRPQDAV